MEKEEHGQLTDAEYNRRKIEIEDEQPSSDDNHDSALVESTKVPSSGGENIILNKKTLFGIDDSRDFIEIPPTPLSEFMQTTFGITDENTAIDKLNQIQSQAYGDLNSDEGEDGEWGRVW